MAKVAAKNTTQAQYIYASLRADLLACRFVPGVKLPINELCDRFDVSLGSVREALSRLSAEGLVIFEAQRGYSVAPVSIGDLKNLTEARIEIEILCLTQAIARGGIEWETSIVATMHRLARTPVRVEEDPAVLAESSAAHRAFHEALATGCGNPWLLDMRRHIYDQSERYRRLSVPLDTGARNAKDEHQKIADAALARDAKLAARLMKEHLELTAEIIIRGMDRTAVPAH